MRTDVIDISHWQKGTINWGQLKASGVLGVINKATEGTGNVDNSYAGRRGPATSAGLLWGAYHFFHAGNVEAQVQHFLKHAKPDSQTLLCCDHEAKASLSELKEFLQRVFELTGQHPVIYSGHVLKEQLKAVDPFISSHRLWLAQYGPTPSFPKGFNKYWLWQHTDKGQPSGFTPPQNIDCNQAWDRAELIATWAGGEPLAVPNQPEPKPSPVVINSPQPVSDKGNIEMFGGLMGDKYSAGLKTMLLRAETDLDWVDDRWSDYYPYTATEKQVKTMTRWKDPCYIGTHSYGLNEFLRVMRALEYTNQNFKVPYLLAIDASQYWTGGAGYVPDNILEVTNFWQSYSWNPFAIRGRPLYRKDGSERGITNIKLNVRHTDIEDHPIVHARFASDIRRIHG